MRSKLLSSLPEHPNTSDDPALLCISLELSRSRWLVTSLLPGSEKMSRHWIEGGDAAGLLDLLGRLQHKAVKQLDRPVGIVSIQEARIAVHGWTS